MTDIKRSETQWLEFLKECADQADDITLHYFNKANYDISEKDNSTPFTQADLECETKIRELAEDYYPNIPILGEEHGQCDKSEKLKLIIDPIDATRNFIRGLPFFATLLAIEVDGEVIAGVVSSPATRERWWAHKNGGSVYNNRPIHVSNIETLEESQAFHGTLDGQEAKGAPGGFIPLLRKTARQRGFGDYYSHVLVAMGCGEFAVDFNLQAWDIAPLQIIVEEAGGCFTDIQGEKSIYNHNIITSNSVIHEQVVHELSLG